MIDVSDDYYRDAGPAVAEYVSAVGADPAQLHRFWRAPRKNQQAKYEQVLIATLQLARAGGYDAVQMRDVASESGISLASIYTYFGSRDNLAYRAAIAWASLMIGRAKLKTASASAQESDPRQLVLTRFQTQVAEIWNEANMLDLWVRSTMTDDPAVVAAQRGIRWSYWISEGVLDNSEVEELQGLLETVQDVFYAGAVRWVFGQQDLDDVYQRVQNLSERLLGGAGTPIAQ